MNGKRESLNELKAIAEGIEPLSERIDALICPPATLLYVATALCTDTCLKIGAQDCHTQESGAFTGAISAAMIADCFGTHTIVGHSERRTFASETDELVRAKAEAAHSVDLEAIICIGETEQERNAGVTLEVLERQLAGSVPDGATHRNTIIAYEPLWAIGTGVTPTPANIEQAHAFMRRALIDRFGADGGKMRLLYGGSVKPSNALELMGVANVDGALIGGASLKSADFLAICEVYEHLIG
jgi:triosephosphate isomerase